MKLSGREAVGRGRRSLESEKRRALKENLIIRRKQEDITRRRACLRAAIYY